MEIKFTVRIKESHNPPTFKEEMGAGVVSTQIVNFPNATEEDLESPMYQRKIFEIANGLRDDWFEVVFEIEPTDIVEKK